MKWKATSRMMEAGDEDKALNIYMERCQYYLKHGTPMIFENI